MIGIVGGVGSYAGIDLIRKIYDQTNVACDQDHMPVAMLSIPHKIPDRTDFLIGNIKRNPGIAIADIINSLTNIGAKIIGIACNAAHAPAIFDCILENIGNKKGDLVILHLIEEVVKYIKDTYPNIKSVGILSTTGTFKARIYPRLFERHEIKTIQVSEEIQETYVHPAIYNQQYGVKTNSRPVNKRAASNLKIATSYLIKKGAKAIVLGCTEIPLAITEKEINGLPIIDATYILARALILATAPDKLKESNY